MASAHEPAASSRHADQRTIAAHATRGGLHTLLVAAFVREAAALLDRK